MHRRFIDDEDTDWDSGDSPDADFDNDDDATIACPYCGQAIYEDSERCPHCGNYISQEDAPASRPAWWLIVGVLLCLGAVTVWILQSM